MKEEDRTHDASRSAHDSRSASRDVRDKSRSSSRRRFTKTIAAALVAAPLAPALLASAQTPPAAREPVAPPNPQPSPSPQRTPQPPSPLAEAYGEVARLRFGDKISTDELIRVKRSLAGKLRTADALHNSKLQNSDEPDFVFSA
jgi:hypothetical protein